MSKVNVQRDGYYTHPDENVDVQTWSSTRVFGAYEARSNSDGTTYYDFGFAQGDPEAGYSITANQYIAVGVIMQGPTGDRTPYRVQAYCDIMEETYSTYKGLVIVGWAPSSPTGSDDQIEQARYFPFVGKFDELLIIEPHETTYANRALYFAVAAYSPGGVTSKNIAGSISVQNMGVKPPTMQNAVS